MKGDTFNLNFLSFFPIEHYDNHSNLETLRLSIGKYKCRPDMSVPKDGVVDRI